MLLAAQGKSYVTMWVTCMAVILQEHSQGFCGPQAAMAAGGHWLRDPRFLYCVPSSILQEEEQEPTSRSSLAPWSWCCPVVT